MYNILVVCKPWGRQPEMGGKVIEEIGFLKIRSSCSSWLLLLRSLRSYEDYCSENETLK